jgi:hypothetical protein
MAAGEVPAHSGPAPAADARPTVELRRGVVGFGGVLFQSITFMAPAIATAFSIVGGLAHRSGRSAISEECESAGEVIPHRPPRECVPGAVGRIC